MGQTVLAVLVVIGIYEVATVVIAYLLRHKIKRALKLWLGYDILGRQIDELDEKVEEIGNLTEVCLSSQDEITDRLGEIEADIQKKSNVLDFFKRK